MIFGLKQWLQPFFAIILVLLLPTYLKAQSENQSKNDIIEQRIEFIAQDLESEDIDFTTLFDDLYFYLENPLDLNTAKREDLERLRFLSDFQITALLKYRYTFGKIYSLFELKVIEGFDATSIANLLPFVHTPVVEASPMPFKKALKYGRGQVILRQQRVLEEQVGYSTITDSALQANPNARFVGDPNQVYLRGRYQYGDRYSIGFTAEKDAGEAFFGEGSPNGFDFYSGHLMLQNLGIVKSVIVGDFQAQFGQGLTLWSGFGQRKSIQTPNELRRNARGIAPYTAANENQFLRGGALTLGKERWQASAFYSSKSRDANIEAANDSVADEQANTFSSLQLTGLHRTPAEIADKNSINEEVIGGNAQLSFERFRIGVTGIHTQLDGRLDRSLQLYNQFELNNSTNTVVGADYFMNLNSVVVFGEVSRSANGAIAQLHGSVLQIDDRVTLSLLYRNYPKDFQNLNAGPIAEKSRPVNENGLYLGFDFTPVKHVRISGFVDNYRFPWLSFQIDAPSSGTEYGAQIAYNPNRRLEVLAIYRVEHELRNSQVLDGEKIRPQQSTSISQYRLQATATITKTVKLRSRIEYRVWDEETEAAQQGMLFYQDLYLTPENSKLSFRMRYAFFDVEDFNARVYAYENDLLYLFLVPAFNNRGTRAYVLCNYKATEHLNLSAKIARTTFANVNTVGSGLNQINDNKRTEFRWQLVYKF